jgi:hypothetical protein
MRKQSYIPDNNPFKVPENYFEEVNSKILSATSGDMEKQGKMSVLTRYRPYLAIAASVAVFMIISFFAVNKLTADKDNHMELYMNDIDLITLEENATSSGISEVISGMESAEIIDYLLKENIEISDIYEQL